jgi:LuxR family maltose regulon positive regulatory protein
MLRVTCWVAMAAMRAARWHLAHREALSALALLEQTGTHPMMAGYLSACLFNVSYAWNQLEEAANWLVRLRQWAHDSQVIELLVTGEVFAAQLALAKGDLASAQQALHQLEALVEHEGFARHSADRNLLRVRVWLAEGNLDQAHMWAAHYTFEEEIWSPLQKEELVMLVRVLLQEQRFIQAEETLRRFSYFFDQQAGELVALEWMALSVITLCHTGKREQAREVLAHLLTLTEPEHFIRVYLDASSLMKQALKMLMCPLRSDNADIRPVFLSSIRHVLAAFDLEEHQRAEARDASSALFSHVDPPSALHEPLTASEQGVLRLLVSGKTYAEMADVLIVSPNTIKTHVSSIYRKLDVNRRAKAIAMAARLHLL